MSRTLSRVFDSLVLAIPLFFMLVAWSFYDPSHDLLRATEPYIQDLRIRLPFVLFGTTYAPSFLIVFVVTPAVKRLCKAAAALARRAFRRTRNGASAAY